MFNNSINFGRPITENAIEDSLNTLIKDNEFLQEKGFQSGLTPKTVYRNSEEFANALQSIEYWRFVQSADYHYFLARVIYLHHILSYSRFCGYQCIENYLKAFLKFKSKLPKKTHDLTKLLNSCREVGKDDYQFINSKYIEYIIKIYEPFYEVARYPVQVPYPGNGYADFYPDGIYYLDYFVFKMREILDIPDTTWDIFKDGHFDLYQCMQNCSEFYGLFSANNINFGG